MLNDSGSPVIGFIARFIVRGCEERPHCCRIGLHSKRSGRMAGLDPAGGCKTRSLRLIEQVHQGEGEVLIVPLKAAGDGLENLGLRAC